MVILGSEPYLGLQLSDISSSMETRVSVGSVMEDMAKGLGTGLARAPQHWDKGWYTKVCSAGGGGSGTKGANIGLSENMESGSDTEAAAGEAADIARKDRRRLAVMRPAESDVVDVDRRRFNIIVIVFRHASTETRRKRQGIIGGCRIN